MTPSSPLPGMESAPPAGAVLAGVKSQYLLDQQRVFSADLPDIISGASPLVAAANPVLNLVPQIRNLAQIKSHLNLRNFLVAKIKAFEREAQNRGVATDTIIGARYSLCTLLDETAGQTPWGGMGQWANQGLLVTFHNETWGGEKFFQLLSKLAQDPQQHRDLLALMFYCLCLGLEGRFRVIDNGKAQLETLRQRLWQILRDSTPEKPETLSPHWQGEKDPGHRGWRLLPAWVVASVALLIGVLIYLWFIFALANQSDKVFAQIAGIRIAHAGAPPPLKVAPVRLAKFLEPEVQKDLVVVRDEADRSIVILRGDGLFASGSANVFERYLPTLNRIAEGLNAVKGNIVVSGYTDNVPIRSAQYPSNFQLSQDRANHVGTILAGGLTDPQRLRTQGLGEADPIVPNDTAENRARNRRVEIVLLAAPVSQPTQ